MAWAQYRLVFRLLSPLHIGYRKVGNLMQTRPYVPGKTFWGALTARLTRSLGRGTDAQAYRDIGALVQQHFRFGYLWPSLDGRAPYFPWEHEDFDYLFLGSYASTALDYGRQAAEEGSLHEIEYIAPFARNSQSVYLVGDLWVEEDRLPSRLREWLKALKDLQLGGERTYGWGRVQLCDYPQPIVSSGQAIGGISWEEHGGEVVLTLGAGQPLTAHALAVDFEDDEAHGGRIHRAVMGIGGQIEPFVGRETTAIDRFGMHIRPAYICYAPGARAKNPLTCQIGPFGIWEASS